MKNRYVQHNSEPEAGWFDRQPHQGENMQPIVCVVGASNSGKTTYLEKLIPEMVRRGYRVGTVKHDVHGFEMDREGKDSWRHRQAGASVIAVSSPSRIGMIREMSGEMELEELAGRYFWDTDIILTEGYKKLHYPKVEVFRAAVESKPVCDKEDNLLATVSDDPVPSDMPVFKFVEVARLADLIEDRFLKPRKRPRVLVLLDGRQLPMKDFVKDFLAEGIRGMLSTLRGWKGQKSIDVQIRLGDE